MIAERIRDSTSDPERPNSFVASACARATPVGTPSPIPPPVRSGSERNPRARSREGGAGFACDGRSPKGGVSKEEQALPATGVARRAEHPRRSGLCLRRAQPEGRSIQGGAGFACDGRSPKGGASKEERALPATGAARRAEHPRRAAACMLATSGHFVAGSGFRASLPAKRALESAPHLGYP